MRAYGLSLAVVLSFLASIRADDSPAKPLDERWEIAYLQGNRAGYVHTQVREHDEKGQRLRTSTITISLTVQRGKDLIRMRMESGDVANERGVVQKIFMRQYLAGDKQLEITGVVDGKQLRLTQDRTRTLAPVAWDDSVIGLIKQQRLVADSNAKPGERLSYKAFEAAANRAITYEVQVKDLEEVELLPGRVRKKLLRVVTKPEKIAQVQLPTQITWLDKDYVVLRSEAEVPGLGTLVLYRSRRDLALMPIELGNLTDIGVVQFVPVKRRVPRPHETRAAVYRITVRSEDDPGSTFAKDERQRVRNVRGKSLELIVRPGDSPPEGEDRKVDAEFTQSCYFINSADQRVRAVAKEAVGEERDPWQKALRIEKWVHRKMTLVSDQALAPADEAARTLKGDCTEYAMLAAAMCRAEGVPSRTAIGMIYVDGKQGPGFAFHMWTEVWAKGRWAAIDATLGRGGISATHLKISDQSWKDVHTFAPLLPVVRVVGKLSIEVVDIDAQEETRGQETKLTFTALKPGSKPFYQELKTTTKQIIKTTGEDVVQEQEQTFVVKWVPREKDEEGNYVVTHKIVGVRMNILIDGKKVVSDSTQKNPQSPMTEFLDQLQRQELEFHVSPALKVRAIKGREELIKRLGKANPTLTPVLEQMLSEAALTEMTEPTWWALPDRAVKRGDVWTKESQLKLGAIGRYDTVYTFTYNGKEKGLDKIGVKAALTYRPPSPKEASGLPFTVKSGKLVSKSAGGEVHFDVAKGRITFSEMNMVLGGTVTITIDKTTTDVTVKQEQKSTSRTTDTHPWEGAEKE